MWAVDGKQEIYLEWPSSAAAGHCMSLKVKWFEKQLDMCNTHYKITN